MRGPRLLILLASAVVLAGAAPASAQTPDAVERTIDASGAPEAPDWRADWRDAKIAARKLTGTARTNLQGLIKATTSLADRRMLAIRLRPAMKNVEVNVDWFWRDRLATPNSGTRRAFEGSDVVFQFFPGAGWQLHPLANLGTLSSLSRRKRITDKTRAWAQDLLDLAVRRDGTIAFEYLFPWQGGPAGWASAMPQSVALETYARLGMRAEAREMLELFRRDAPTGVRFFTATDRAHYLMYTQAPQLLIGNGFAQAILSLDAYAKLEPLDAGVQDTYQLGLREARAAMAAYDTGAWSLYYHEPGSTRGAESDLHYHRLFREFLEKLCDRLGGEPFCGMAERFTRYETEPVALGTPRVAATRTVLEGRVSVSKRSTIRATLYRGTTVVRGVTLAAQRGTFKARFDRPAAAGDYRIVFDATALTGQRSRAEAARTMRARPSAR